MYDQTCSISSQPVKLAIPWSSAWLGLYSGTLLALRPRSLGCTRFRFPLRTRLIVDAFTSSARASADALTVPSENRKRFCSDAIWRSASRTLLSKSATVGIVPCAGLHGCPGKLGGSVDKIGHPCTIRAWGHRSKSSWRGLMCATRRWVRQSAETAQQSVEFGGAGSFQTPSLCCCWTAGPPKLVANFA